MDFKRITLNTRQQTFNKYAQSASLSTFLENVQHLTFIECYDFSGSIKKSIDIFCYLTFIECQQRTLSLSSTHIPTSTDTKPNPIFESTIIAVDKQPPPPLNEKNCIILVLVFLCLFVFVKQIGFRTFATFCLFIGFVLAGPSKTEHSVFFILFFTASSVIFSCVSPTLANKKRWR